jgi:hypothetical protein
VVVDINETRLVINIGRDPLVDGLGDDTGPAAVPNVPKGVTVTVGYDPLDDLGDDTGEKGLPGIPGGVQVNIYDPTRPGLGDDTSPVQARRVLVINVSAELMRSVFG